MADRDDVELQVAEMRVELRLSRELIERLASAVEKQGETLVVLAKNSDRTAHLEARIESAETAIAKDTAFRERTTGALVAVSSAFVIGIVAGAVRLLLFH